MLAGTGLRVLIVRWYHNVRRSRTSTIMSEYWKEQYACNMQKAKGDTSFVLEEPLDQAKKDIDILRCFGVIVKITPCCG